MTRHPAAFLAFGAGPRNCVGMRFGLMEAKLVLVRMMREFSFEKCDQTQIPLQLIEGGTITPKDGVYVKVVKRASLQDVVTESTEE